MLARLWLRICSHKQVQPRWAHGSVCISCTRAHSCPFALFAFPPKLFPPPPCFVCFAVAHTLISLFNSLTLVKCFSLNLLLILSPLSVCEEKQHLRDPHCRPSAHAVTQFPVSFGRFCAEQPRSLRGNVRSCLIPGNVSPWKRGRVYFCPHFM